MDKKYGIDQLKPLLALAIEVGNVVDKMGHTSGAAKYTSLMSLADEIFALSHVDFKLAKEQIKEVDAAEKAELMEYVKNKFDIVDDKLEGVIEESIDVLIDLEAAIEKAIGLYKNLKN